MINGGPIGVNFCGINNLKKILHSSPNIDYDEKQELINNMDLLKKKFVRISKNDIENVKHLMRVYGATYYDAPGEADELCAMLTIKGKVWACLSEDMDMFVYGCPRVIRYFSLLNHTIVLYDMKEILDKLGFTQKELREICILSGTDSGIDINWFKQINKKRSDYAFPHIDQDFDRNENYTCLVYLNSEEECSGGTGFFKNVYTDKFGITDKKSEIEYDNFNNNYPDSAEVGFDYWSPTKYWEMLDFVEMKPNRMVIFPAKYYHAAYHPKDSFYQFPRLSLVWWMENINK
jgi:hypothetical protein